MSNTEILCDLCNKRKTGSYGVVEPADLSSSYLVCRECYDAKIAPLFKRGYAPHDS